MSVEDYFTYHLAESGRFVPVTDDIVALSPIVLSNPGNTVEFEMTSSPYAAWEDVKCELEVSKPKNQPYAQMDDFICYGKSIVEIAQHLAVSQPECCLAPLRGAVTPAPLAEMTTAPQRVTIDYFDYRYRESRRALILAELANILSGRNLGREVFRLAIIDCSIGGNGITDLVPLLKDVWRAKKQHSVQRWYLDVHLLHDLRGRGHTAKMKSVQYRPYAESGKFEVRVTLHEVPKLITEDYSPAIDFRLDPKSKLYVPLEGAGTLLFRDGPEVRRFDSSNAFLLYKKFFIEGIRQALESHVGFRLCEVVWNVADFGRSAS